MEEFPPVVPESNPEPTEVSKKRRRVFGESGWLNDILRRPKTPEINEEEDDEEESETPISKSGRSTLRKFFRSLVRKEEVISAQATPAETESAEPLPSVETTEQAYSESPDIHTRPEHRIDSAPTAIPDTSLPVEQPSEHLASPGVEPEQLEIANSPQPTPETLHAREGVNEVSETTPRQEVVAAIHGDTTVPTQERIVRVEHIERPSPATALVALEYIGRKRADRKIKKTASRLEKRVIQGEQRTNDQLESLARQSREQAVMLQERRSNHEATSVPRHRSNEVVPPRQSLEAAAARPEIVNRLAERPTPIRGVESIPDQSEVPYRNAEQVLRETVEAADKDTALEKVYERRQEIKDDQGSLTSGQAASIGAVLQQQISTQDSLSVTERKQLARAAEQAHREHEQAQKSVYQQAVISGFATACVITAGFIAVIMLK